MFLIPKLNKISVDSNDVLCYTDKINSTQFRVIECSITFTIFLSSYIEDLLPKNVLRMY